MTSTFSDICVVCIDKLGDAVLKSGFVRTIGELWPEASITIICSEHTSDYWWLCPYVDRVLLAKSIAPNDIIFASAAKQKLFDLTLAPRAATDYENCHFLVAATKATIRIGFRHPPEDPGENYNREFTHLVEPPIDNAEHVYETPYRSLNELTSKSIQPKAPEVWVGRRARKWASQRVPAGLWLAMGLGASHPHKIWPPERFAAVATQFVAKGWGIVLTGAASERALACRFLAHQSNSVVDLVGMTGVEKMAAALDQCSLFIGNDSGPKHVAAALGKPIVDVSWLNCSDPIFRYDWNFWPIGARSIIVKPPRVFTLQETFTGVAVESVTVEAVLNAAETIIGP